MIKHNPASELSNPRVAERRPQARTRRPRAPQTFEQLVLGFLTDLEQERGLGAWVSNTQSHYRGSESRSAAIRAIAADDLIP